MLSVIFIFKAAFCPACSLESVVQIDRAIASLLEILMHAKLGGAPGFLYTFTQ
jgi:hypothetical protein